MTDVHFYLCFWRPDILPKLEFASTTCGGVAAQKFVTVDRFNVTCPQCNEILNSSSEFSKIDWKRHHYPEDIRDKFKGSLPAPEVVKGWTTRAAQPGDWSQGGDWTTKADPPKLNPQPGPQTVMWSGVGGTITGRLPPVEPKPEPSAGWTTKPDDGWTTKK